MANVVDTLITRYQADPSGFVSGTNTMIAKTKQAGSALANADSDLNKAFSQTVSYLKLGGQTAIAFAGGVAAAGAALVALGANAAKRAADFDALLQALAAVTGGMSNAKTKWEELRKLAGAPGIGPEEALSGYTGLRRSGLTDEFAKSILKEFANQNALAGGGKEEFGRLIRAVTQIATKPFLQGEELLQLTEAGVPAYKMVKDAFGTTDTEELKRQGITSEVVLKKLLTQLEKTARVGDSAKNSFENLETSLSMVVAGIGAGVNSTLMGMATNLGSAFDKLHDAGIDTLFGETLVSSFQILSDSLIGDNSLESAMIEVGAMVVTVGAALRNFALNLKDIFTFLAPFINMPAVQSMNKGLNPHDEGQNFRDEAAMKIDLRKSRERQAERHKNDIPQAPEKQAENVVAVMDKSNEILRSIESNTKPLVDIKRMILGGGALGENGLSPIELKGMKGAHGRAANLIFEGIGLIVQGSMIDSLKMRA